MSPLQSSSLMPLHYQHGFHSCLENLINSSVTFWEDSAPLKLPATHCSRSFLPHGLESTDTKSGISLTTPYAPKGILQSLPPILRIASILPIRSYSKAPRGLFVFPQVIGIFTDIAFSPSCLSRQFPPHYAIRARLKLPDKEFRYLRTVRVTADIHRGLYDPA